jgi:hypothetical protein
MKITTDWASIEDLALENIVSTGARYAPEGLAAELVGALVAGARRELDRRRQRPGDTAAHRLNLPLEHASRDALVTFGEACAGLELDFLVRDMAQVAALFGACVVRVADELDARVRRKTLH